MDYRQLIVNEFGQLLLEGLEAFGEEIDYEKVYKELVDQGAKPSFNSQNSGLNDRVKELEESNKKCLSIIKSLEEKIKILTSEEKCNNYEEIIGSLKSGTKESSIRSKFYKRDLLCVAKSFGLDVEENNNEKVIVSKLIEYFNNIKK